MSKRALAEHLARDPALEDILAIDAELARVGRKIRVLKAIDWPNTLEDEFLAGHRANRPVLPEVRLRVPDLSAEVAMLDALMARCDRGHPLGDWHYKGAWSYRCAAQMLMGIGTPEFTRNSVLLYGRPDTRYRSQDVSNAQMAEGLLAATDDLVGHWRIPEAVASIPAEEFAAQLRACIDGYFTHDKVEVVLDPDLSAKACAGSKRIAVRSGAMFTELDLDQLVQHEAFVHTATALNGKHQPFLKSLALGTPRTTRAQEGLATFAEIITDALDIKRLRRLAVRVRMVHRALDGADFIEVFRGFCDAGQDENDAYKSAERIFRGGDPRGGGVCFTKDGAYLEGVFRVFAFLRLALKEDRPEFAQAVFCGRVTMADAVTLAPWFETGFIAYPRYVPPWARDLRRLLAVLAFFDLASKIRLDTLTLQRFVDYENEVLAESLAAA